MLAIILCMKLIFWRMSYQNSLITINRIYIKKNGGNTAFTTIPIEGGRPHWKVKCWRGYNVLSMRQHCKVKFSWEYNVLDMRPHWKVIFLLKYNVLDIRPHWKVIFSSKYNVSDKKNALLSLIAVVTLSAGK